jgi:hypothetical protein
VEVMEKYQVKISNRFAALENLDDNMDSGNIRQNIKISPVNKLGEGKYILI